MSIYMNRRNFFQTLPALGAGLAVNAAPAVGIDRKARLRTAICAYSFRAALGAKKMTYEDLVRLAVELDVDGLDLTVYWFPNTSDEFLLPLKRLAFRMAVEIYSISIRTEMTRPTTELQAAEVESIKKWVDVAERMGAGHIRVFGGRIPKDASEDQAAGWVVEILKRAADYSGRKGVTLGLENHGGITARSERIIDIIKRVGSPWVGVNLDTGNFEKDGYRQIETLLPYAVNSQLKVQIRDSSGERQPADWDRLLKMFAQAGYKGYFALEYEEKEDPATAVPRMTRQLNALARKYSG